jgi:hypothetical protein
MKTKANLKSAFPVLLCVLFIVTATLSSFAQERDQNVLKDFKIIVQKTENGVKMQGVKGTAWIDLSFSLKNHNPQAVDEYGMTEVGKVSQKDDSKYADFLFTITTTEEGILLKGIEGTAWIELSFTLSEGRKQAINQFGMTK